MKIAIQNGRVICPANGIDKIADIGIENGKIIALGTLPSGFDPDKKIEAKEKWVLPGLVDSLCRPQIPHLYGASLAQELQAATQCGITSLCIPPDGDPIIDSATHALRLIQQGSSNHPHLYPMGALTNSLAGGSLCDLMALRDAGCIAFSNAQKPIQDLQIIRHCYDFAASFDLLVVIQPQDPWLAKNGVAHEGLVAARLGLPGIPETAETTAVAQHLLLIEQSGIRAHFSCLSSAKAIKLVALAKAQGLKVTADLAMHALHLSENDLLDYDANCHLYPPLRSIEDKEALLKGLAENTLDAICSDHRPLEAIAKLAPFGDTLPGLSAIDTFLALGIHLVQQQKLSLTTLISAITCKPAQIFNLPAGTLSKDAVADICIVDPALVWEVKQSLMSSQGKNTPFKGWEIPGIVTHTLVNGLVVHER